ncbi:MAG TPA: 7-cyano-7-deazaguanine synthase QueC [Gammaproteobacteria bacterium]|nr:7-cyano-7-deazaguanine synthase QueC [Gammaproteobacteria bacterium]
MQKKAKKAKKAIILFSGGLDSTTCLAIAKEQGFIPYALSFDYGQKHKIELNAAKKIAKTAGVLEHKIFSLTALGELSQSALTDPTMMVPDYKESSTIPTTYVPARNTIFLSIALGWAEVLEAYDIFIGANDVDYSNYPDCRPAYIQAFETLANLATKAGVEGKQFKIHAPLLQLNKSQVIQTGLSLGVDYSQTVSCYRLDDKGRACGCCDSCTYRKKGFFEANVADPTRYVQ